MSEYNYDCKLSKQLIEKAEKELNEKEKWRDRDIQVLRDMVVAHKGLKCPLTSAFLVRFLRARKFDYERAYELLINYYTIRATNAEILKELTPSAVQHVMDQSIVSVLPVPDKENRKILYFRPGKWNPESMPMIEILRINILSLEEVIKNEETQVNGIMAIGNFMNVGMSHVRNLDRNYLKIMTGIIQDAFPMRLKGMHFINEPTVFGYIFSIVKPFLKEKMVKRLSFHGSSLESLYAVFDKSCLPNELGGDLPSGDIIAEEWRKTLTEDEQMFQEMKSYKIELAKNIFGTKTSSEASSECFIGSYKKISE